MHTNRRWGIIGSFALLLTVFSVWNMTPPSKAHGEGFTTRVSVTSDGIESNAYSNHPFISGNGRYVVFTSGATNLVPGDTNNVPDVFVHDLQNHTTARVSIATDGTQSNAESGYDAAISADGRYIAFNSGGSNLVPNDTNDEYDIFVRDQIAGTTERVSLTYDGNQSDNDASTGIDISADGRYVVFSTPASNMVPNDTNSAYDIFMRDRLLETTVRISIASDGSEANHNSHRPSISGDGQVVAFYSFATNLVSNDTNNEYDVFVSNLNKGTTTRVSVNSNGEEANSSSSDPSISQDGNYVTFGSGANNLVLEDTNDLNDIFVSTLTSGVIERVSVGAGGVEGNGHNTQSDLSADGRFVVFSSASTNLVEGDTNGVVDIFVYDRLVHQTTRVSLSTTGDQGNLTADSDPSISHDGSMITFASAASNLVPGDTNNLLDVFVRQWFEVAPTATPTSTVTPLPDITATPTPSSTPDVSETYFVYLPLSVKQYQPLLCLSLDLEPNNASASALQQPPLCQGRIVPGTLPQNDPGDYYRLVLTSASTVNIDLFDIALGGDFDLYVYDRDLIEIAVSRNNSNSDERIGPLPLSSGTYYIRVYPDPTEPGGARSYNLRWIR